jgi:hypothetical protein
MPSATIITFPGSQKRSFLATYRASAARNGKFDIPYEDIAQYLDSANESLSDPVVAGARATVALKRLFEQFGIQAMPETLGELLGALWYCKILDSSAGHPAVSEADVELWDQSVDETFAQHYPELLDALRAVRKQDLLLLQRIARTKMPLSEMQKHFHPDMGWAGDPHLVLLAKEASPS